MIGIGNWAVEGYNEDHDTEFEEEDVEFHL